MLKVLSVLIFNLIGLSAFSQTMSPGEFLGYKIGERFTPHWKIVNYFQHVASTSPANVKLVEYGRTYEDRPLLLAFISSSENISRLEQIRLNNLRLAHLSKDKAAPVEAGAPAIVWLSYNVHGNEASSSEAAMLTIWALLDPSNQQTKEWLRNTVVVIDPCINPDGRDRYVNWFNSIIGKEYNAYLIAREHREPWPGGRTNHYNFDLNRDWAWQTQVESRQRIKVYNQWMPQVHVDYHEQGINSPYYFAPAAEPYHEVITPWQRDFQVTLGRNHAKYFDAKGWLYFTKEVFDLFYPSYGDTYPTYNGAIGMTYEQAGGAAGGAAALINDDDTLTLMDRVMHHYTTGISTIETSSRNAGKLISEFKKYFDNAVSKGFGEYKTYLIRGGDTDRERIWSLMNLLDKNGIEYEFSGGSSRGTLTGYSYKTGSEELFTVERGDLLVQSDQARSALVRVLFEPDAKLVDSNTYDITAWSLPYVFGLDAYASKNKISTAAGQKPLPLVNKTGPAYGYVISWQGMQSAKVLVQLMQKEIRVRYSESPFDIGDQHFERGSLIILQTGNEQFGSTLPDMINGICNENNIKVRTVSTGFVDKGYDFGSSKVHSINAPRVALLSGEGVRSGDAGEIWYFFEQTLNYPLTVINAEDFRRIDLSDFDVLIMPSGNYGFLNDKSSTEDLKEWIRNGGKLVALDGGVSQLARTDWAIKTKKEEETARKISPYESLHVFEERQRENLSLSNPGSIFRVELDSTHPLAFGYPAYYYTLKQDDRVYEFFSSGGWNVGVLKKDDQVSGFVGARIRDKIKDGLLFGVQQYGRGNIVYLADNLLFRNFWENGKLMFCNAVFLVGQ